MSRKPKHKGSKLTADERITIQGCLRIMEEQRKRMVPKNERMTVAKVAEMLDRRRSTIYREIARNSYEKDEPTIPCPLLGRKCLICNLCPWHNQSAECRYGRRYYNSHEADLMARERAHGAHEGPRMSQSQFETADRLISDGVRKGQSIENIYRSNMDELSFTNPPQMRRMVRSGFTEVRPAKLRRYRRLRKKAVRNSTGVSNMIPPEKKVGRTMSDFVAAKARNPGCLVIQCDSVVGRKTDRKRILTLMPVCCGIQMGYLYHTGNASKEALAKTGSFIRKTLPYEKGMILVLCDNGCEFSRYDELERISPRVRVFFADPYRSCDKANCERNHEFFRYCIPKGVSFDGLTQKDVSEIFLNINNYARESLKWKTPYECLVGRYPIGLAETLGLVPIPGKDVDLSLRLPVNGDANRS